MVYFALNPFIFGILLMFFGENFISFYKNITEIEFWGFALVIIGLYVYTSLLAKWHISSEPNKITRIFSISFIFFFITSFFVLEMNHFIILSEYIAEKIPFFKYIYSDFVYQTAVLILFVCVFFLLGNFIIITIEFLSSIKREQQITILIGFLGVLISFLSFLTFL